MNILENLENLNVSEECYNDILTLAEEYINEVSASMLKQAAKNSMYSRRIQAAGAKAAYDSAMNFAKDAPSADVAHRERVKAENNYGKALNRYQHAGTIAMKGPDKGSALKIIKDAEDFNSKPENSNKIENPYKYASRTFNKGRISEEYYNEIIEGIIQKVKDFANNQVNKAALGLTNSNSGIAKKVRSTEFAQKHIFPRAVDGMIHNANKAEQEATKYGDGEAAIDHHDHANRLRQIKGSIEKAKQRGVNPLSYVGSDKLNKHSVHNPEYNDYDSNSGIRDVVKQWKSK